MENATHDTLSAAIYDWAAAKRFKIAEHRLFKSKRYGWYFRTTIYIGTAVVDGRSKVRSLTITTDKCGQVARNVSTFALVSHLDDGFSTLRTVKDFGRELGRVAKTTTEKSVRELHESIITPHSLDTLVALVEATYITNGEPLASTFYPAD